MKVYALFFALLLSSGSISASYAHPILLNFTLQNQNGMILYQQEIGAPERKDPASIETFSEEWFYYNFIWILVGVIIASMAVFSITTYKEEIFKNPPKPNKQ